MRPGRRFVMILPVAWVAAGGCLATRSDVERLQLMVQVLQDSMTVQQARSDAAYRALVRDATAALSAQFTREFAAVSDSVRRVSAGLQRVQGDLNLALHDIRGQLVTVQEAIGVSQRQVQALRTTVEAAAVPPPAPPAGAPGPGGAAGASPPPGAPPAAQLFQMAREQLRTSATASARHGFQQLVDSYPTHELAGEAQMYIGDAYGAEGNRPAADSVYGLVVTRYPGTAWAARSLYKRAMFASEVDQKDRARSLAQEIVDKYPRSNEKPLAELLLQKLKQP